MNLTTEPFSHQYELVHGVRFLGHNGAEAEMDRTLFDKLAHQFGDPVVGRVGGLHYYFKPSGSVPKKSIAVPEDNHEKPPETFLVQR